MDVENGIDVPCSYPGRICLLSPKLQSLNYKRTSDAYEAFYLQ